MSCSNGDNKDPPKPKFDPFEYPKEKELCGNKDKKVDTKEKSASGPCEKPSPKDVDEVIPKKPQPVGPKVAPPTCQKEKLDGGASIKDKIKLPSTLKKITFPPNFKNITFPPNFKNMIPEINLQRLKNIEYGKLLKNGFSKLNIWIRENCNPKKMADKGSGAPSRPMKFPYTFSAKIAQFPLGHYVKNQWIWKYYVVAFAACMPIFYSINKLANSPGNVAKWAEIRRKEAAEHHH